jgi:iron complex transport system substrate-binding protein
MRKIGVALLIIGVLSCNSKSSSPDTQDKSANTSAIKYAKYFEILEHDYAYFVTTFDRDRKPINKIIVSKIDGQISSSDEVKQIVRGATSTACLSSVFVGFLSAVNRSSTIVAVDELDHISNEVVRRLAAVGKVSEVGGFDKLNLELLASERPDLLFAYDFDQDESVSRVLRSLGIYTVVCNSFREKSPLARAEWIKLFGVLTGEYEKANRVFAVVEKNYLELKYEVKKIEKKPTVFMHALWGDQWSIPGGNSFQARLMEDAGADYIWGKDTGFEIIFTGFETMLMEAGNADYWLNVNTYHSMKELYKADSRYKNFKAYKDKKVYNNNANENEYGGIPYWETGAVRPDWVLSDLIEIFHPDVQELESMKYYHNLK